MTIGIAVVTGSNAYFAFDGAISRRQARDLRRGIEEHRASATPSPMRIRIWNWNPRAATSRG